MAAEGNKDFVAKLKVFPFKEMKKDASEWIKSDPEKLKVFAKPITYQQKVELNEKKWSNPKLEKALGVLVRAELQLLAQRVADTKKKSEKEKSPKKVISTLKKHMADAQSEIAEKCMTALDDLESGKGEVKAGLAILKKLMNKVNDLDPANIFSQPMDAALASAKAIKDADKNGGDVKGAQAAARKEIDTAVAVLNSDGKEVQGVAKYLASDAKKLKNSEIGPIAAFGKKLTDSKVTTPFAELDKNIDKLESALATYSKNLKDGKIDGSKAGLFESEIKKMSNMQKSANTAVKALQNLHGEYKKIEKDLK